MTQAPTRTEVRTLIVECLDDNSILEFENRETFFDWLETATHWDAMDSEEKLEDQRETILEVYEELFLEEFFNRNKSAPQATAEPGDDHHQMSMALEAASTLKQHLVELHSNGTPVVSELVHDSMVQMILLEARIQRWNNVLKPSE